MNCDFEARDGEEVVHITPSDVLSYSQYFGTCVIQIYQIVPKGSFKSKHEVYILNIGDFSTKSAICVQFLSGINNSLSDNRPTVKVSLRDSVTDEISEYYYIFYNNESISIDDWLCLPERIEYMVECLVIKELKNE